MINLLFIALFTLFSFPANARSEVIDVSTLEWKPYSGTLSENGFLGRIVKLAFEHENVKVNIHVLPWNRALKSTKHGVETEAVFPTGTMNCNAIGGIKSDKIDYYQLAFAYRKNEKFKWSGEEDFKGLKVGVVSGYDNGSFINSLITRKIIQTETATDDVLNLKMLERGRLRVATVDPYVFSYLQNEENKFQGLELNPKLADGKIELFLCFRNTPSNKIFLEKFNRGLAKVNIKQEIEKYLKIKYK